jgi:probable HAF family extracellular repeat protein
MKSAKLIYLIAAVAVAVIVMPLRSRPQEQQQEQTHYTITDIGTLGGFFSTADAVNAAGSIGGASLLADNVTLRAMLWHKGVSSDLGTLGGPNSNTTEAQVINDRDEVVGFSDGLDPDPNGEDFCGFPTNLVCLPFVWKNGAITPLPTLGGPNGQALSINNRGQIAGAAEGPNPDPCSPAALEGKAVIWHDGRIEQVLPTFAGSAALAAAINNGGDVVGLSGCNPIFYAVLWRHGRPINLGSLGGVFGNIPSGLNDRDEVVGQSDLTGDTLHQAFLWRNGVMTNLGSLPGLPTSVSNSINNKEVVVGFSQDANSDDTSSVAWVWQKGVMTNLNDLIPTDSPWFLMEALNVNDRGEISGFMSNNSTGEVHGFLATPVNGNENVANPSANPRDRVAPVLTEDVRNLLRSNAILAKTWSGRYVIRHTIMNGTALISAPSAILSPTSLTFSTQAIGTTSVAKTVTLKNTGTASLSINTITITGTNATNFAQTHTCGSSLAAGASCTIRVTFNPQHRARVLQH